MSNDDNSRRSGSKPPRSSNPDPQEHSDDSDLFRRAMADARPLQRDQIEPIRKRIPAKARFARRDERDVLRESLEPAVSDLESGSGETLSFCRPAVGRRTFRQLVRGKYSIQSELDLHGMTVNEAREALTAFIETSVGAGRRCVRIIHGKGRGSGIGGPVLKGKVDRWLRRWEVVIAFASAQPVDGGSGAVYVLLKNT